MAPGSTAFKVCGLTRPQDAAAAAAAGARYGGVILAPGGRRSISPERAAEVFNGLLLRRVGVFVDASAVEIRRAVETAGLHVVQLHGDEGPDEIAALRPPRGVTVWKAIRPRTPGEFVALVDRFAAVVDGVLVDGWSAAARGGTGTAFPWKAVAEHRHRVPASVALVAAGGLRPDNVTRAIELLAPTAVDVSSGVESAPGIKDLALIREFAAAVARANGSQAPR